MRIEGRVFQAALKSYALGDELAPAGRTLVLDGILGPQTQRALFEFDDRVHGEEGGELWGDYSIAIAGDQRSAEITPDSVGRRFQTRGSQYMLEHPGEVVFARPSRSRTADVESIEPSTPPAPLALPFWRPANPWAWLFSALGFFGLSGIAFWVGKRMRRA